MRARLKVFGSFLGSAKPRLGPLAAIPRYESPMGVINNGLRCYL
jgi:hypothetical protein